MHVADLIERLKQLPRSLPVELVLRISADPEEHISGKLTGCATAENVDTRSKSVVLVAMGAPKPATRERTVRAAGRGAGDGVI